MVPEVLEVLEAQETLVALEVPANGVVGSCRMGRFVGGHVVEARSGVPYGSGDGLFHREVRQAGNLAGDGLDQVGNWGFAGAETWEGLEGREGRAAWAIVDRPQYLAEMAGLSHHVRRDWEVRMGNWSWVILGAGSKD